MLFDNTRIGSVVICYFIVVDNDVTDRSAICCWAKQKNTKKKHFLRENTFYFTIVELTQLSFVKYIF